MLNKKIVKNILLEVEACCYHYEKYLQDVINEVLNNNNNDIKYLIVRENDYLNLTLYKYSQSNYIEWLYNKFFLEVENININELINNYSLICEYIQQNYINYFVEENILNFINVTKFRKELYNNNSLLQIVKNNIATNIQNYVNNEYLVNEYNLNKKLYKELLKIKKEVK